MDQSFNMLYGFPHLSLTFFLLLNLIIGSSAQSQPSIYDHLRHNGLPVGLLPKGITDFSLDPTTGHFHVNLTQPCDAKFENQFHYDFIVSGFLSFGHIGNLSGVTQQELFLWFPVKGIRVDVPSSGLIYFDVGVVDKQFSLSLFEIPRDCTTATASHLSGPSMSQSGEFTIKTHRGDMLIAVS